MPWEDYLLPTLPSPEARQYQNSNCFDGKYIGIVPLIWNPLNLYNNSLENQLEDLDLNSEIRKIRTDKSVFLVQSIFYFLWKEKKKYYPVFKYPSHLPFTLNHLKDKFSLWLTEIGYNEPHFTPIRIYRMKGFHLFVLLLDHKIQKLNPDWKQHDTFPFLEFQDQEIVNSMMKVSQKNYDQKERLRKINLNLSQDTWDNLFNGYLVEEDQIFPFQINFEQILATLSNQIDSQCQKFPEFYFQPLIRKRKGNDIISEIFKKRKLET